MRREGIRDDGYTPGDIINKYLIEFGINTISPGDPGCHPQFARLLA
jgi:hypothetical protein